GFIPQIIISLVLASWFTDVRLRLRFQGFFKTVIYMPNLIMASAFAMLFFTLFSDTANGPVNSLLLSLGVISEPIRWMTGVWSSRGLVGLMNFLMWFGNTTIILMAAIMGVDPGLYEAAELDGASSRQMFWKITMPLIKPMLVYTLITSLIGGLQMFDVPQVLTNGKGSPNNSTTTIIMYLNQHLYSKNYGTAGAISVILFLICGVLCVMVYSTLTKEDDGLTKAQRKAQKAQIKAAKKAARAQKGA
ncbi:MAG: carbohydrate ABC transporter permease, partial [Gemmiger sp.]